MTHTSTEQQEALQIVKDYIENSYGDESCRCTALDAIAFLEKLQSKIAPLRTDRIEEIASKHRASYPSSGFDFEEFDEVGFCRDLEIEYGITQERK